jgi:hypothetical protein
MALFGHWDLCGYSLFGKFLGKYAFVAELDSLFVGKV